MEWEGIMRGKKKNIRWGRGGGGGCRNGEQGAMGRGENGRDGGGGGGDGGVRQREGFWKEENYGALEG